jgi:hypothetical protein
MDPYADGSRSAISKREVINEGNSRFELADPLVRNGSALNSGYGAHRQVFEKRHWNGEAERRSNSTRLERDCRTYGSRSAPDHEGSR